jgi:hypothetical protein
MHSTVVSTLLDLAVKLLGWAVFGWTIVFANQVDDFLGKTVMDRMRARGRDGARRCEHCPCRARTRHAVPADHRARWQHAGRGPAR